MSEGSGRTRNFPADNERVRVERIGFDVVAPKLAEKVEFVGELSKNGFYRV